MLKQQRNQKERAIFNAAVRELLRHGINVASTDANFEATRSHLHFDLGVDFAVENVLAVLKDGNAQGTEKYGTLNLSANDPAQVKSMDQQDRDLIYNSIKHRLAYRQDLLQKAKEKIAQLSIPELRSRVDACTTLAKDYSKDPRSQDPVFTSHFASLSSTADLQAKAAVVLENRRLRGLTPQQLREEAAQARGQQPQQVGGYPPLPDSIDGDDIIKMSANQIRDLIKRHGRHALDLRLAEYREAVQAIKENRSPRF